MTSKSTHQALPMVGLMPLLSEGQRELALNASEHETTGEAATYEFCGEPLLDLRKIEREEQKHYESQYTPISEPEGKMMTDVLNVTITGLKDVEQVLPEPKVIEYDKEARDEVKGEFNDAIDEAVDHAVNALPFVDFEIVADWLMLIAISYKYKAHQEPE